MPSAPPLNQFALAALIYEMLSKRQPFFAESTSQVLHRVISVEPLPLRRLVPSVPAHVEQAVERALSKEPGNRFPTVSELIVAMSAPRGTPLASRARRPRARLLGTAGSLLISLLILALGAIWASSGWFRSEPQRLANPNTPVHSEQPPAPVTTRTWVTATGPKVANSRPDNEGLPAQGKDSLTIGPLDRDQITADTTLTAGRPARRGRESYGRRRLHSVTTQPASVSPEAHAADKPAPADAADQASSTAPKGSPGEEIDLIERLGSLPH